MIFKKIFISETEYKIRQFRDDGRVRWVDKDHAGYLRWLAAGNVPEEVAYVPPVIPADDDPVLLRQAKQDKIAIIRREFMALVAENFDAAEIAIRNMKEIVAIREGKAQTAKFTNMVTDLNPYITWRNNLIQSVRACTLVSQVEAISVAYP